MKKIVSIFIILFVFHVLSADVYVDSLKQVIESLPFSYEKGDKIWDLAIYQTNNLKQAEKAIKNFNLATQMFVEMDSLESAVKAHGNVFKVAFTFPENFEYSKQAFKKHLEFLDNPKLAKMKRSMLISIQRHLLNAYILKEMEELKKGLAEVEIYFDDRENDDLKLEFDHYYILMTNYYYGEEKALTESMKIYENIQEGKYNLTYPEKELARVKMLSNMQNYHYYRGDIEQSSKLLAQALDIARDVSINYSDQLTPIQQINLRDSIGQLMTLKTDNIEIKLENLAEIEQGYLDVNKFTKSYDPERTFNNFTKIAHAYDVIYTGKHPKVKYYLDKAQDQSGNVQNKLYLTNYYLTKARYLLNRKDYKAADLAFAKVEDYVEKSNQSWIKFNYIMERSRYYFEQDQTKKAYDMITGFYKSIDKDFSNNIAEKTAELNNQLDTQKLIHQQTRLEDELRIKSLQNSRETLVTTLVGIVLGFTTLLLVNNVRLNKKLKTNLHRQGSQLKEEMEISQKRAQELIFSEKLSTSGQIASSIAHEIKNPLTNIITAAKLLHDSRNENDIEKFYNICQRNSWLAIDKINALLEYSKQKKMNFVAYSLKSVMKEAYNLSKGSLEDNQVNFQLIYNTHDDVCTIDPKEITGVLVNLILNSVQAMEDDNEDKRIDAILDAEDKDYIITIKDNGEGIETSRLDKIFNPFYTTKVKGTGLGLSYAQKVILEHHGSISIDSKEGNGTQVVIRIPRQV